MISTGIAAGSNPRAQLEQHGYFVFDDVIDRDRVIQPLLEEYSQVLDQLAGDLFNEGKISQTHSELPFTDRLVQVVKESGRVPTAHFDITLPQSNIRADTPIHLGPAVFNLITDEALLDRVEDVVGPEITVNPVQHVRLKLPMGTLEGDLDPMIGKSPWHQDGGVFLEEADDSDILTVWVPLSKSTLDNGCMRVVPTQRQAEILTHCPSRLRGAHIPDNQVDVTQGVPLPMSAGSLLMLHARTLHDSLPNTTTDQVRISLDLRFQATGTPTGRPQFPSFVARSRSHPERELRDPAVWKQMWLNAREQLSQSAPPRFHRWDPSSSVCA
ncbi:MAG: phytanoyl-CoA dioxygenase family protein [Mycobacterium sp.]